MNCFCGIVDRRKEFRFIFSRDHCQRSSPSRISNTPRPGFELVQNLSWCFFKRSCALVITTTPRCLPLLSNTPTTTDNSLSLSVKWYGDSNFCLVFKWSCLKQKIVDELNRWSRDLNFGLTLKDSLFGGVKLAKNADPHKYAYWLWYWIQFAFKILISWW